jgi:hypothetical protein
MNLQITLVMQKQNFELLCSISGLRCMNSFGLQKLSLFELTKQICFPISRTTKVKRSETKSRTIQNKCIQSIRQQKQQKRQPEWEKKLYRNRQFRICIILKGIIRLDKNDI